MLRRIAGRQIIPFQTSGGCPFDCSFCAVTGIFGKNYRFRSTENILAELRQYDAHHAVFQPQRMFMFNLQRAQICSHSRFYSILEMVKIWFQWKWVDLGLAYYSRNLNRVWQKKNATFMKAV